MRQFRLLVPVITLLILTACGSRQSSETTIRIIRTIQLASLPSASGITASENGFLVNSDNAPYLYLLNADGALQDSIHLLHENRSLHEIPKPVKPDYEAATLLRFESGKCMLLLGSGSMSPHRDSAMLVMMEAPRMQRKADLRPFYKELIRLGIPEKSINIEAAAASSGDELILFNRGDNRMIRMHADSFIRAVFDGTLLPEIRMEQIQLPAVNGFTPGISGATMMDDSTVLFCGSVEATTDWAKDGEILGSGIGIIQLKRRQSPVLHRWTMLNDTDGALLREKLEGIEVLKQGAGTVTVRCVTDNDNGSSTLMDIELRIP